MLVHGLIRRHNACLYNPEADDATQFSQRYYTLSALEGTWLCDRVFTNVSRNSREVRDFFTIRYPTEDDLNYLKIVNCCKYLGEFGND